MKKKIRLTLLLTMSLFLTGKCQQGSAGWADLQGGTTGGQGGQTVTVASRAEFIAYTASADPLTIRIRDTLELNLYERVKVNSNKTIIGITINAMLRHGGLEIIGDNVIIRNLIIRDSYDGDWSGKTNSTDAITITGKNVWVDHCWLAASADGLLDVRSENDDQIGDFVTVSYTRFSDHNKVSLIGSSDDSVRDRDHLNTTFHHCWFDGTLDKGLNQRLPRIRYGSVHLYNNYFENIGSYCTLARLESDVVVENNYYRNANNPHDLADLGLGEKNPELRAIGNIYDFSGGTKKASGEAFKPSDFYDYEAMAAIQIPAYIMNEAGPFNRSSNKNPIAKPDTVFLKTGERSFELDPTINDFDEDGDDLRIGAIINEIEGVVLIRNNIIRYIAPPNPQKTDTLLYEVVDTEGGYAVGTLIIQFEGLVNSTYELLELEDLKIFPNPASDWIQISFSHLELDEFMVKISDLSGRTVYAQKIRQAPSQLHEIRIPVKDLNPGHWVVSIANNNAIVSQKIIIREKK